MDPIGRCAPSRMTVYRARLCRSLSEFSTLHSSHFTLHTHQFALHAKFSSGILAVAKQFYLADMFRIFFSMLFFAFFLVGETLASPLEFFSKDRFSSSAIFSKLDSIGGGGTWMEWDMDAVLDPEISKIVVEKNGKFSSDLEHGWLLKNPDGSARFAVLRKKSSGESLAFYEIPRFSEKKVPLEIREPLDPRKVFRDYRETLFGHFVHLDDTNLQVVVREGEIQFSYLNPDSEALVPVPFFERLPESRKRAEIQVRRDFYAYEYALMVQSLVASTRGLFNWQIWHWLSRELTSDSMIRDEEIAAVLASPEQGKFVRIFFRNLPRGYSVEMLSNAHGAFILNIRRK